MFDSGSDQALGLRQMMHPSCVSAQPIATHAHNSAAAQDIVLCMHSDPQSIKNAYQIMKNLTAHSRINAFKVYVCDEQTTRANKVFDNFSNACAVYLGVRPILQGILPVHPND
jgi:MinD-like ATPase involved in chromosome partitioning or flagellar assembly